jgi:hypothetical protein
MTPDVSQLDKMEPYTSKDRVIVPPYPLHT